MRILPPQTLPPRKPLLRRHAPRPSRAWTVYRSCLRWDFGFTCAFCLLHEADLYGGRPGEGLGGMTVEHRVPRSEQPSLRGRYANCLLACRFCNQARGALGVRTGRKRLLDPTRDSWSDHFERFGDRLRPRVAGGNAEHTHATYDLDDPRKVVRRRLRRELISDRLDLLAGIGLELDRLLRLAEKLRKRNPAAFFAALREVARIRSDALRALEDLRLFAAIPSDKPSSCRCASAKHHRLPTALSEQTIPMPILGI